MVAVLALIRESMMILIFAGLTGNGKRPAVGPADLNSATAWQHLRPQQPWPQEPLP